jgi:hypothetical protein
MKGRAVTELFTGTTITNHMEVTCPPQIQYP